MTVRILTIPERFFETLVLVAPKANCEETSGTFEADEVITQASTGAVGRVVEWDSNLSWYLQDEFEVSTANPASYVVDGKVMSVIGPVQTMVGDTLILTGTIREHLISDTIKFILE